MSKALEWLGEAECDPPPTWMLVKAAAEPWLRLSKFHLKNVARHVMIRDGRGEPVGFCTPQRTASGLRFGPIWVVESRRGEGWAADAYRRWATRTGLSAVIYVEDGNERSARAAEAAGMRRWKRGPQGQYWKMP